MNCIKSIACPKCGRNEWDGPTYFPAIYTFESLIQNEYLNYGNYILDSLKGIMYK
jgi:hypothetical protein